MRCPGEPTPCESCPRESPDREAETTLSEKNAKAYAYYLTVREMGVSQAERSDAILRKSMGMIGMVVRDHELSLIVQASLAGGSAAIADRMMGG